MKEAITETIHLLFDGKMLTCTLHGDTEIEVHHVRKDHKASEEITGGKKFLSLVITSKYTSITPEAQKESMTRDKHVNMVAQAIVIHSLSQRILGNFMIRFLRYPCPCQLFTSREKAVAWLNEMWKDRMGEETVSS